MPADVDRALRAPVIALVHHPLCLEAGLSKSPPGTNCFALEKAALALARPSSSSPARPPPARSCADFAVPRSASPSPSPAPIPRSARMDRPAPLQLLAVGSIVPRKAYDILVRALGTLDDRDWRLTIAGATDRSPQAPAAIGRSHRATRRLGSRIAHRLERLAGAARRLDASADASCMPSLYEGYGMVLAEAMARGLPIVCTTGGAAAETVPDAAGLKVPPGDEDALAAALRRAAATIRPAPGAWPTQPGPPARSCRAGTTRRARSPPSSGARFAHERILRAMARPARAGRPPLPQRELGRRLARHFEAGGRSPSSISAAAPAPTCAPRRRCSGPSSTGRWSTTTRRLLDAAAERLVRLGSTAPTSKDGQPDRCSKVPSGITVESGAPTSPATLNAHSARSANLVTASALFDLALGRVHRQVRGRRAPPAKRPSTRC